MEEQIFELIPIKMSGFTKQREREREREVGVPGSGCSMCKGTGQDAGRPGPAVFVCGWVVGSCRKEERKTAEVWL